MKLAESFNKVKLQTLIDNYKQFDIRDETYIRMNDYLNSSINGTVSTYYYRKYGSGRRYSLKGLSMQMMDKRVRHTIADDMYTDIDMVNAHPVILQHICRTNNIRSDELDNYIDNRESILKKDRNKIKRQYLVLMNSDNDVDTVDDEQQDFASEMNSIREQLCDIMSDRFKSFKCKDEGKKHISFMHDVITTVEDDILMCMYEYFGEPEDVVLIYDGMMLRKNKYDIKGCEQFIKNKLNIKISLEEKKMNNSYDLSTVEPSAVIDTMYDSYQDVNKFMGKVVNYKIVDYWLKKNVYLLDDHGTSIFVLRYPSSYHLVKYDNFKTTTRNKCCTIFHPDVKITKKKDETEDGLKPFAHLGIQGGYIDHCITNNMLDTYYSVDYHPHLMNVKPDIEYGALNMFRGFPLDTGVYDNTDLFTKSKFMYHLKDSFFKNDEKGINHFLDTVADMIQNPTDIKETGYLFYSKQGCGKGTLAKFMQKLLGDENVYKFENSDIYFESRFNSDCSNKILKIFEEVSEKGKAFSNHNRLKAEISMDRERIEHKGINPVSVRHCARYWFFTNNRNALYVEDDDRRITFVDISDKHKNDKVYFKQIIDEISNPEFMKSAFNFFASRKYETLTVRSAYTTEYKISQKMANLSNGVQFVIDYIRDEYQQAVNKNVKIPAVTLRSRYKEWCESSGVKYHVKTLDTQMYNIGVKAPERASIEGTRMLCYVINSKDIQDNISSRIEGFTMF